MWWFGTTENTKSTEPPNHIKAKEWTKKNGQNNNNNNKYIRFFHFRKRLFFTSQFSCFASSHPTIPFHSIPCQTIRCMVRAFLHSIHSIRRHTRFFISIHFFGNFFCLCLLSGTFTIFLCFFFLLRFISLFVFHILQCSTNVIHRVYVYTISMNRTHIYPTYSRFKWRSEWWKEVEKKNYIYEVLCLGSHRSPFLAPTLPFAHTCMWTIR